MCAITWITSLETYHPETVNYEPLNGVSIRSRERLSLSWPKDTVLDTYAATASHD